jgi:hypothetical protein
MMKLSLRLKHHVMKTYTEQETWQHAISFGTTGRWVSVTSRPLSPRKEGPLYPLDRRLGGHQSWLGSGAEENYFCPCRELNFDSLVAQSVA